MPALKLNKSETEKADAFSLAFEEPPEENTTRRSKNHDTYFAAIDLCIAHPNQSLKLGVYNNSNQPYGLAKAINNNERKEFLGWEGGNFEAIGRKIEDDEEGNSQYGIWIKFVTSERQN